MDVFISWSGERSRAAAEALHGWLPKIINALKPWLSSADIDQGARWTTDVASRLEAAKAGIICLTPDNLHSDWILFEAGALSKTLQNTFVCPLLIGLEPADVKPPLAQFQATRGVKADVLKLLLTLNKVLGEHALDDEHIKEAFEVWWPRLEQKLKSLPAEQPEPNPRRSERELLEEILALVRNQNRTAESAQIVSSTLDGEPSDPLTPLERAIWDAVESADPSFWSMSDPNDGKYEIGSERGTYTVMVPDNTPLASVGEIVRSQVPKQGADRIPAKR